MYSLINFLHNENLLVVLCLGVRFPNVTTHGMSTLVFEA